MARIRSTTTTYFDQAHLGSVRLVTDASGLSVFNRNYRPFGTEQLGSGVQDYKYTYKPGSAYSSGFSMEKLLEDIPPSQQNRFD